jgi:hypothetical protein
MAAIQNWMKDLDPKRKLVELCLPGSHDAGVYQDLREAPFRGHIRGHTQAVNPDAMARCQYTNIWEQAMCGSRVFDIRVFLRKDRSENTEIPTMGHFFKETTHGHGGDYGGTLMSALNHAARFLAQQPSEFLIFRIGHTVCTKEVVEVLEDFRTASKGAEHRLVIHAGAEVNLASLQYQQLKGKLLLVFDNPFMSLAEAGWAAKNPKNPKNPFSPRFSNVYGYYPYDKYPNIPLIGLSFCGKYDGGLPTALKKEKGNWTAESADLLARKACAEHEKHRGNSNHLLWVYWQQTGGNVWQNTTAPGGMRARLPNFLLALSTNGKLGMPNVIGHDFVTKETCASIVKLNPDLKDTNFTQ